MAEAHPARVLVVDDEPEILGLLMEALGNEGYLVATASDGEAALAAALAVPPALVLTDLLLPGIDGADLCRRLKADPRTRAVPVLIMTALASSLAAEALVDCPHDGAFAKPFSLIDLFATIAALCSRQAA
jgi:DNA-binding response OmpR family regulator